MTFTFMDFCMLAASVFVFRWLYGHYKRGEAMLAYSRLTVDERILERHKPEMPSGHQILAGRVAVAGCFAKKAEFIGFAKSKSKALILEVDPQNPYDRNAVKVVGLGDGSRFHIGYLPREIAEEIARYKIFEKIQPRLRYVSAKVEGYFDCELDITAPRDIVKSINSPEPQIV